MLASASFKRSLNSTRTCRVLHLNADPLTHKAIVQIRNLERRDMERQSCKKHKPSGPPLLTGLQNAAIEEAMTFSPTEEQFRDPLRCYIA